jgi:integrase
MTVEEARKLAKGAAVAVQKGEDPSSKRQDARKAATVADLAERYLEQHAAAKKKERSIAEDRRILAKYVLPSMKAHRVADVTRVDVDRLHHAMRETPIMANRVLALLSKMLHLAERWGMRPDGTNPCRHVEKFKENRRERYLAGEELGRLGEVLAAVERERIVWPTLVPLIRLLILTGARLDEIRTLRWEHVDLEAGLLRLPDSKTGAKIVHLNPAARQVLAAIDRKDGNSYIIWGARAGEPLVNVKDPWARIRVRAKLADVRLHDLRHTFASMALSSGASLPLIGKLLGHTQPATTARYAHLARDAAAELNDHVGDRLAAALTPDPDRPKAEVVNLAVRRR